MRAANRVSCSSRRSPTARTIRSSASPPPRSISSTTTRTYSETPIGPRRVRWADRQDGRIVGSGEKWVSEDGQTLSFPLERTNEEGEDVEYLFVYDRTGPSNNES